MRKKVIWKSILTFLQLETTQWHLSVKSDLFLKLYDTHSIYIFIIVNKLLSLLFHDIFYNLILHVIQLYNNIYLMSGCYAIDTVILNRRGVPE